MNLEQIPPIAVALKLEKTATIKAFHRLLFDSEGNRQNRARIRAFTGFNYSATDADFQTKLSVVTKNFSLLELISIANLLRLEIAGTETELAERILNSLCDLAILQQQINDNKNSESESEDFPKTNEVKVHSDGSDLNTKNLPLSVQSDTNTLNMSAANIPVNTHHNYYPRSPLNFADIEGFLPKFHGDKHENINVWLQKFETVTSSFNIPDLQKFLFAEKSLSGLASLYIRSEANIFSFDDLKSALLNEFGSQINSAEIHNLLTKRRKRDSESLFEYLLVMKEIASRSHIDDISLIRYIIQGIGDTPQNKSMLFECLTLHEFKHKLKIYEEIQQQVPKGYTKSFMETQNKSQIPPSTPKSYGNNGNRSHKPLNEQIRCFLCGRIGHKSSVCRDKNKGAKCFRCNQFGHKASDNMCSIAPQTNRPNVSTLNSNDNIPLNSMHKLVSLNGLWLDSLIDTGSQATLLREDVYRQMNKQQLKLVQITLTGFGSGTIRPLGSFQTSINIDDVHFSATVHVIPTHQMTLPLIIGTDVITQGVLTYDSNGISLTKPVADNLFVHLLHIDEDPIPVDLSHITNNTYKQVITELVQNYKPIKSLSTDFKMNIILQDDIPVCQRPRRMSVAEKQFVSNQVDQWLTEGIIKASSSEYASPIVLVKKKDNSTRLCIDYRKLNKKILKDNYPLPLIDDILDQLQSFKVFTSIDLKNGFFHVHIDPGSTKYTAFITHNGQYEFLKAPFGLSISPSNFNKYLTSIFRDLLIDGTLILYMDDFIIPSKDENEGIVKLKRVMQMASTYGLNINFKKCQFLKRKIEFLGHIIENNTISPSPAKIKAVQNFPEPTNIKHLQSFLGLAGYFRKYIPGYASIAKPLSDLLRKSSTFNFGSAERTAFLTLKNLLIQEPVLQLFVPGSEIEVHTDASKFGFGAVLLQKSDNDNFHPVLYMSKKTSPQEEKLHSYELEVLAVIEALKKFRVYLHGTKFKIITDCEAFQKTMDKTELSAKIARWALFLQDFDFQIIHRSASRMQHVDCLSRYPVFQVTFDEITQKIQIAQSTDDFISSIKTAAAQSPVDGFFLRNNILYKTVQGQDLLVVPQAMQLDIIHEAHAKGHFSAKKTEELVSKDFFIPHLTRLVQTVITNCVQCILSSRKSGKQEGLLHPIPKGNTPLDTYHTDFLGPLPSTNKRYKYLFTVVDAFTKFIWIYPVRSTSAKDALDKLKLQQSVFGNPRRIISDKGSAFTSSEFKHFCEQEDIELVTITTGVPRGNGQIERFHGTIIPVLTKISLDDPMKWYKHVASVQRIINSTTSSTTKFSPFELLTGIRMRNKEDLTIKNILETEYMQHIVDDRVKLREVAKNNILHKQQQNRLHYNKKRKPPRTYNIGDLVAIQRTQFGTGLKLRIKFFGPYKVIKVKPNDRYDVQKIGQHDGPSMTSTAADLMKPWAS